MSSFPGVASVIGAASGIGRATAILFASQGCNRIAIGDTNAQGLAETRKMMEQVNDAVDVIDIKRGRVDVSSEDNLNRYISKVVEQFGRVDYACNVAGITLIGPSPEFPAADFDKQFSVNARGMWLCQKAELTQMLKQEPLKAPDSPFASRGSIVNVGSTCSLRVYENLPSYCATKHAIIGFTKADGMRYAKDLIRVNAVCPGIIDTPLTGYVNGNAISPSDNMAQEMAMGRLGQPEEIAEALLWLCSGRASFVTAIALPVNGGMIGT